MTTTIRWPAERPRALPLDESAPNAAPAPNGGPAPVDVPVLQLPAGAIDYPDSGSMVPRSVLTVHGWAMFPAGPPDRVELSLDATTIGRARLCCAREDVRRQTGVEAASVSGFSFDVELWRLEESVESAVIAARAIGPEGESLLLESVEVWLSPSEVSGADATYARGRRRPGQGRRSETAQLLVATGEQSSDRAVPALVELLGQVAAEHEVGGIVLSAGDNPALTRLANAGFDVHLTGPIPVDSPGGYEDRLEELAAWAGRQRFDAALIDTIGAFPAGDLAVRLGIPAVWAIHESIPLASQWELMHAEADPYMRRRAETALRASVAAVFDAEKTRRLFADELPGVPCVTVPHGVDAAALDGARESVDRDKARARRGIPGAATVVLCTGTFSPPEEQAALVWAFARVADSHPNTVLVLIDELGTTDSAAVALAVSACGLGEDRIRIEPQVADLSEAYAIADVFVCAPDWRWLCSSILEAMAVGLPVLGTAMLGIPELIEDGVTGWLSPPGDIGALAFALNRVLGLDESARRAVAEAARERVRSEHDSRASARAWGHLLTQAAARRAIHVPSIESITGRLSA